MVTKKLRIRESWKPLRAEKAESEFWNETVLTLVIPAEAF